jgi:predicted pyridoxine 5'-phosphate oxidase superfamily flavin-nucleotide-binding protein
MIELTQEMKDLVARVEVAKFLATINPDGTPNIGPKRSTHLLDDGSLAYAEVTAKHHYENVKRDPRVAIAVVDWTGNVGFRFVGEADVHESGELYDEEARRLPPQWKPRAAVRVKVTEVHALSGPQAGERIL